MNRHAQLIRESNPFFNPIPTGHGLNQPIYSYHVTQAGRNRVNVHIETLILNEKNISLRNLKCKFMAHFMPHLGM